MLKHAVQFQARIFLSGRVTAPIPEAWRSFDHALTPVFVSLLAEPPRWVTGYLPVYAALLALLSSLGAAGLLNPLTRIVNGKN